MTPGRRKTTPDEFQCATCGAVHKGPPFDYSAPAPDPWLLIAEEDREGGKLTDDLCWIQVHGEDHFFVRGLIPIPVLDSPRMFNWGVWAAIAPTDFRRVIDTWDDVGRAKEPPFPGCLATDPAVYPESLGIELSVQLQGRNDRPTFIVTESDHPIAADQRNGITVGRVKEIAETLLHTPQR